MGCSASTSSQFEVVEPSPTKSSRSSAAAPPSPPFHKSYRLLDRLGKGAFAQVYLAKDVRKSGSVVAVKITDLRSIGSRDSGDDEVSSKLMETAEKEIDVLRRVAQLPHCVGFVEALVEGCFSYIVMERCETTLLQALDNHPELTEATLAGVFHDMLKALSGVHALWIVHRDIKPDNFLYSKNKFKLCDFGLSEVLLRANDQVTGVYGTAPYMSPEMLAMHGYGTKTDMWSFGVLAYVLLLGHFPYQPAGECTAKAMKAAISLGLPAPSFATKLPLRSGVCGLSPQGRSFLMSLVNRDAATRFSADQALEHEWFAAAASEGLCSLRPVLHAAKRAGAFDIRNLQEDATSSMNMLLAAQQAQFHHEHSPDQDARPLPLAAIRMAANIQQAGEQKQVPVSPTASTRAPSQRSVSSGSRYSGCSGISGTSSGASPVAVHGSAHGGH